MAGNDHMWTVLEGSPLMKLPLTDFNLAKESAMDRMIYPKSKVLKALVKNRATHLKIVQEAQIGYRRRAIVLVEELLKDLKAGKGVNLHIPLALPDNHVDDFDRAIQMIEMGIGKNVELDQSEFQCYVRNKWSWERSFLATNANYSGTAFMAFNQSEP